MSKIIQKHGIDTKKRYKKIQIDMIFVPMPYYGISIGHIYNKKAGPSDCVPLSILRIKKRDCNLAVPHIEALVLPFVTNSNTVAHAVRIIILWIHANTRTHT